jgi:hypothetical protein
VHRLLEKQSLSHVTKRCKVKIINSWSSTSRCTNLLLWPVCFVRHVGVDRFRVDRECRHEENWLRLNERLVRSRVQVHALSAVQVLSNVEEIVRVNLKKNLISIFLNILCQTTKKNRASRDDTIFWSQKGAGCPRCSYEVIRVQFVRVKTSSANWP